MKYHEGGGEDPGMKAGMGWKSIGAVQDDVRVVVG